MRGTKTKTVHAFVDTYSGPEFNQMERITDLVIIVWVMFLFAPG